MIKFVFQKSSDNKSLFKNKLFHDNYYNENAVYIKSDTDIKFYIESKNHIINDSKLYFNINNKFNRDFNYEDNVDFENMAYTCFLETNQSELKNDVHEINNSDINYEENSLYLTTFINLLHDKVFTLDELRFFNDEQIKELILFSNLEQYNLICQFNELHSDIVKSALSNKYLSILADHQGDFNYSDICEIFFPDFFNAIHYENIFQLKDLLNRDSFKGGFSIDFLLFSLPTLETPPTHEWLFNYYHSDFDLEDDSLLFDYFDLEDVPYSSLNLLKHNKNYKSDLELDIYEGYRKHIIFSIKSHIEMIKENNNLSKYEIIELSRLFNWIHLLKIDADLIKELFELQPLNNNKIEAIWSYGGNKNEHESSLYYLDFDKGDLFNQWVTNIAFGENQGLNIIENIQYLINNHSKYLKERDIPSKSLIEHFIFENSPNEHQIFKVRAKRLANDTSNCQNAFEYISRLI